MKFASWFFLVSTAHAQSGVLPFQNIQLLPDGIIIRDVELLAQCDQNSVKLIDQGKEIVFRAKEELCRSLQSELGHGGCGVLIGDATIKNATDGIFKWDEITKTERLREGCPPVASMVPHK